MRNIYSHATRFLIWLDTSDSDNDKVMAHFAADDLDLEDEKQRTNLLPGLQKLFGNPWFTRMWVVQELLVAHKVPLVGCGDAWVSWSHFEDAMYLLGFTSSFAHDRYVQRDQAMLLLELLWLRTHCGTEMSTDKIYNFETLLVGTSDRKAKDPKDKIFALLGLASNEIRGAIAPKYSQSTATVFQHAMVAALELSGDLELLHTAVALKPDPELRLRSWCLEFSITDWLCNLIKLRTTLCENPKQVFVTVSHDLLLLMTTKSAICRSKERL